MVIRTKWEMKITGNFILIDHHRKTKKYSIVNLLYRKQFDLSNRFDCLYIFEPLSFFKQFWPGNAPAGGGALNTQTLLDFISQL
jgi:hypothetical protein